MVSTPLAAAPRPRITFVNPLRMLLSAKPWLAAIFAFFSFVIGTFWFVILNTLIPTGLGLAITFLGLPLLVLTMVLWTLGARAERWRVALFFGISIPAPYQPLPKESLLRRTWAFAKDPAVWKDLCYLLLLFPIGIIEFVITTVALTVPLALVTFPAYYWIIPGNGIQIFDGRFIENGTPTNATIFIDTLPEATLFALAGLPLLLLLPYVLAGIANAHVLLARTLLGVNRQEELEARVGVLTESRSRAVDAALTERRRIERDLHDGAQQRLVAVAMNLGMAKIKLESDPEAARKLVDAAHQESKLAMVEIRNLVRGIYPAVLTDRGLDAAISALAGRSPIPVAVIVELDGRLPETVESTAYFVVAEALTNVAKHSVASEASVTVRREEERLLVEVFDDGVGGADAAIGTGLAGIADRVAALDGRLHVSSPRGGPTRVYAELPCGL